MPAPETQPLDITDLRREIREGAMAEDRWDALNRLATSDNLLAFDRAGEALSEEAKLIAEYFFSRVAESVFIRGGHNCYGNDMFYVAHRLGLAEFPKKRSAVIAVWNGRHKYFEWLTHAGFDNSALFRDMGLVTAEEAERYRETCSRPGSDLYCFLDAGTEKKLIYKLGIKEDDVYSARFLSPTIWHKETTNNRPSGQYRSLPLRHDLLQR